MITAVNKSDSGIDAQSGGLRTSRGIVHRTERLTFGSEIRLG